MSPYHVLVLVLTVVIVAPLLGLWRVSYILRARARGEMT